MERFHVYAGWCIKHNGNLISSDKAPDILKSTQNDSSEISIQFPLKLLRWCQASIYHIYLYIVTVIQLGSHRIVVQSTTISLPQQTVNKLEAISFGFGFARTHGGCHRLAKHVYNSSPTSTIRSSRADAVNWATIIDLSYELSTQQRRRHIIIETNFFTKFCFISNRSHTQHTHRR